MFEKRVEVRSFEELIQRLEHVEFEQFETDIPANVRAELSRIKRNSIAVLSFLAHCKEHNQAESFEFYEAVKTVRRQCIDLNMAISRLQLLYWLRIEKLIALQLSQAIAGSYRRLGDALQLVCGMSAPQLLEQLSTTL